MLNSENLSQLTSLERRRMADVVAGRRNRGRNIITPVSSEVKSFDKCISGEKCDFNFNTWF